MRLKVTILAMLVLFSCTANAAFKHVTMEQVKAGQTLIIANGYSCNSVDEMQPFVLGGGFTVYCNGWKYEYELEDKGGRWIVTPD